MGLHVRSVHTATALWKKARLADALSTMLHFRKRHTRRLAEKRAYISHSCHDLHLPLLWFSSPPAVVFMSPPTEGLGKTWGHAIV
jgi:hypothetical protein